LVSLNQKILKSPNVIRNDGLLNEGTREEYITMGESISHRKPEEGQQKKVATYTSFKSNEEMAQEAPAACRRKPAAGVDNREAKLAGVLHKDDERALEY